MEEKKRTASSDFFGQNFGVGSGTNNTRNANKKMSALSMQVSSNGAQKNMASPMQQEGKK